jgi:hypothetical protein
VNQQKNAERLARELKALKFIQRVYRGHKGRKRVQARGFS